MIRILKFLEKYKHRNRKRITLLTELFEFLMVLSFLPVSFIIVRTFIKPDLRFHPEEFVFFAFIAGISWFVLSRISVMSQLPRTQRYIYLMFRMIRISFVFLLILMVSRFVFSFDSIPFILIFTFVSISLVFTISMRLFTFKILKTYRASGYNLHRVILIADSFSDGIIEKLTEQKEWGFKINSIITKSKLLKAKYGGQIKIYSDMDVMTSLLDNSVIDEVIYCRNNIRENEIRQIVNLCNEVGVVFRLQSSVSPLEPLDLQLKTVNSSGFLKLVDIPSNNLALLIKTMADFYFSITMIILLAPLFLLIGILIRINSPGPVLFKQERIGLRGRKFKLFKFRTMHENAEDVLQKIMTKNEMDGPVFKIKNDPRITSIGRLLRKTGLDELPQLYNVFRGEMSLIGPRPPLETEVKQYERWQLRRLSVKPGITCSWQIVPNRNDVKFEKWMKMDLQYIDNWSLYNDAKLFFRTISTIFLASGR